MYQFALFKKPVSNKIPYSNLTLNDLYVLVTTQYEMETKHHQGLTKEQQDGKYGNKAKAFDYVCMNATFRAPEDQEYIELSGYFTADIDKQKNIDGIFAALAADKIMQPAFMFRSPSGNGIKAVYKIPITSIDLTGSNKMRAAWHTINGHLKQNYAALIVPDARGSYIDEKCKDLARRTFICHDKGAYINAAATVIEIVPLKEKLETKQVSTSTTIQDLHARHLLAENNHGTHLRAFIWACCAVSLSQDFVADYISEHVSISPDSKYLHFESLLSGLYKRYHKDGEAIKIRQDSFAKGFFVYKKPQKGVYDIHSLHRDAVTQFLNDAGYYRIFMTEGSSIFIRREGVFISQVSVENIKDAFKTEIDKIQKDLTFEYQGQHFHTTAAGMRDTYDRDHGNIFTRDFLQILPALTDKILHDLENEAFFFYRNCIVAVQRNASGETCITFQSYEHAANTGFVVWKNQVIGRDIDRSGEGGTGEDSQFFDFLKNVTKDNPEALMIGIGYIIHSYYGAGIRKAVELTDSSLNTGGKREGGTGKGLILEAVSSVRKTIKIVPNPKMNEDRFRYQQVVAGTQVLGFDEVPAGFDLSFAFTDITGSMTVEKKHMDSFQIPQEYSPKLLICTNTVLKGEGSSYERRLITFELKPFYQKLLKENPKCSPILDIHGNMFFDQGWTPEQFHQFDMLMFECVRLYFEKGLQDADNPYYLKNKLIASHGEKFIEWCDNMSFVTGRKYEKIVLLEGYNGKAVKFQIGQKKMTQGIMGYAKLLGMDFIDDTHGGFVLEAENAEKVEKDEELPF
jgi:hypothetical protein